MKKTLIILFAVSLGLAASVNAQTVKKDKIKFGFKAGGNLMTLGKLGIGANEYKFNYQPGLTAGVFSKIPLGGTFSFIPEINYSQKGADVEGTVSGTTGRFETRISYIDVPILFSYAASPKFSVFAGPQVSFFLNQKTKTYVNNAKTDENTDSKEFEKTIAGAVVGLGYDITPNIDIKGRYMMDFQKGAKNNPLFNYDKTKNSGFSLTLGYSF